MGSGSLRVVVWLTSLVGGFLIGLPDTAHAELSLYQGSIRVRLSSYTVSESYSIPFGALTSYPSLNNLPSGNPASVTGSAPAKVAFGADQMTLDTALWNDSPPASWGVPYVHTDFEGANGDASFSESGGPGSGSFAPLSSLPGSRFGVSFSQGPARFGGTMRLLASFEADYSAGSRYAFRFDAVGGDFGGTATVVDYRYGTFAPPEFFTATVWGFPWTTGTVSARVPGSQGGSPASTAVVTAMGSDQRTPKGAGQIQMVTPFVVRARQMESGNPLYYRAGVAVASLHFVPEPSALAQLTCGLGALAALYRASGKRRR